jgi:O-antigen/teichoic acid export membrane protein
MKSILQVFSFDLLSKILVGAIGILLIRYMEATEYALFTFSISVISVVAQTLSNTVRRIYIVGYDNLLVSKPIESFLGLQILTITVFSIAGLMITENIDMMYFLIINMILGTTLIEFSKTIFQQELNFKRFSQIEIVKSILIFLFTTILIYKELYDLSAWKVLLIQSLITILISASILWRKVDFKSVFNFINVLQVGRNIVKGSYKFLIGYVLFSTILSQQDVFMLKYLSDNNELATYGSAFRYYTLLLLALSSVNSVLLPVIQDIKTLNELDLIYSKHKKILIIFVPIVLIGAFFANWIFPIIDLGKYPNSVPVFQILSISAIISFTLSPHINFIMKFEDFKFLFYVITISIICNGILNLILINLYGSIGAALATLITYGFSNFMTFIRAKKYRNSLPLC